MKVAIMTTNSISRDTTVIQKPNHKNRDDIKVIITAVALTLTLAFWNLFSSGTRTPVQVTKVEPNVQPVSQVKILMGGPPPKTTIVFSQSNSVQPRNQRNQQNVQQSAPQPVTNTASSK
jgi:hypothetical protein